MALIYVVITLAAIFADLPIAAPKGVYTPATTTSPPYTQPPPTTTTPKYTQTTPKYTQPPPTTTTPKYTQTTPKYTQPPPTTTTPKYTQTTPKYTQPPPTTTTPKYTQTTPKYTQPPPTTTTPKYTQTTPKYTQPPPTTTTPKYTQTTPKYTQPPPVYTVPQTTPQTTPVAVYTTAGWPATTPIIYGAQPSPVPQIDYFGSWGQWSYWSYCSVSCGNGISTRNRTCLPSPTEQPPLGSYGQGRKRRDASSSEDTEADAAARYRFNDGESFRDFQEAQANNDLSYIVSPPPDYSNGIQLYCEGEGVQQAKCNIQPCATDGAWTDWSQWSLPTITCGKDGLVSRTRSCDNPTPANGGKLCIGSYTEQKFASTPIPCPIDGCWTSWTKWTPCSATCGYGGVTERGRVCSNPAPANGGAPCEGDGLQTISCCGPLCPVDGNWGAWGMWSTPTLTCGKGSIATRVRHCDSPSPESGGKPCAGSSTSVSSVVCEECPLPGGWTDWTSWTACSVTCGTGFNVRSRTCDKPAPLYGGGYCPGDNVDYENCTAPPCPIDGGWSLWTPWSTCSASCGLDGQTSRTRICDNPYPASGGAQCENSAIETINCFINMCPVDGGWSVWSAWTYNSVTCDEGGQKSRTRTCSNPSPQYGGDNCFGDTNDVVDIDDLPPCPINGGWTGWSDWSANSVTCGYGGISVRTRDCLNPPPAYGGLGCVGETDIQTRTNVAEPCPVNGGWAEWSDWSDCTVTCGINGVTTRTRTCSSPYPQYSGLDCTGSPTDMVGCIESPCPIDGAWSFWSEWSLCSVTCGAPGTISRYRQCDSPAPAFNGAECDQGDCTESQTCNVPHCPINGAWGAWSLWSQPSLTCGYGSTVFRQRLCNYPEPQFGGHGCGNNSIDYKEVSVPNCPVDGGWTTWSPWTDCTATCGNGGSTARTRSCTNPTPQYGGDICNGDSSDSKFCILLPCPIDGNWGEWSAYTSCSVTCGNGGFSTRSRVCNSPSPAYGGGECDGSDLQSLVCQAKACAVDGQWGQWSDWSDTSVTCGFLAVIRRSRNCDSPAAGYGGQQCVGDVSQSRFAPLPPCPVDGGWTAWSPWNECSVTCGAGGVKKRQRYCEFPEAIYGGDLCEGPAFDVQTCSGPLCPIDGIWSAWSAWSTTTVTCGTGGFITHTRTCSLPGPSYGGKYCPGLDSETVPAILLPCPTDGGWGAWNSWAQCSVSCGVGGTTTRTRQCDNPAPLNGGALCPYDSSETVSCSMPLCAIDGGWGSWGNWSLCSATCGDAVMTRTRSCDSPQPQFGGQDCMYGSTEQTKCPIIPCPIDGGWTYWSTWSDNSLSCGRGGIVARSRTCTAPTPAHNGENCIGVSVEVKYSTLPVCEEDGGWAPWTQWSQCNADCDEGLMTRTRSCTMPSPTALGALCQGDWEETQTCNTGPCPVPGGWTSWYPWSPCSVTCGDGGLNTRTRTCENPAPLYGGDPCPGDDNEERPCTAPDCSIDGGWSDWSPWATCSVTCGNLGITLRTRECNNPAPQYGGVNCIGYSFQYTNCSEAPCAVDGGWGGWTSWTACSQTCGYGGTSSRSRVCNAPVASYGGNNCPGAPSQTRNCYDQPCEDWYPWSDWSACIQNCGVEAYQYRTRSCSQEEIISSYAANVIQWCDGDAYETISCAQPIAFNDMVTSASIPDGCGGLSTIPCPCVHNWIVVLNRDSPSDFDLSWDEYKNGFGDINGNFYIGNEELHCLTKDGNYRMRYEVQTVNGVWYDGEYKSIVVDSEDNGYALHVETFSGTTGDLTYENGMKFTTSDNDNDFSQGKNCAKVCKGGWWYNNCYEVNLMGEYVTFFEIKQLGANSHLSVARILIQRLPDDSDIYGPGGNTMTAAPSVGTTPSNQPYPS